MKKSILWLVIIIVVIFAVSMLVRPGDKSSTSTDDGVVPTPIANPDNNPNQIVDGNPWNEATSSVGSVKELTVTGSNFAFAPKTLTVNKGDTVKITFVNSGGFHDLKIDEFNVATQKINGGAQEVVTFVADKAGTFEYYCSVGTHRQMGMVGTLTVK